MLITCAIELILDGRDADPDGFRDAQHAGRGPLPRVGERCVAAAQHQLLIVRRPELSERRVSAFHALRPMPHFPSRRVLVRCPIALVVAVGVALAAVAHKLALDP